MPDELPREFPAGANLIGMILWPKARRSIPPAAAREIAAVARRHGAEPVAVFVDESAEEIARQGGCCLSLLQHPPPQLTPPHP